MTAIASFGVRARPARHAATRRINRRRLSSAALWLALILAGYLAWPTQLGGTTGYTIVAGHSMDPTFHTGDLLITRREDHYRIGQVVVYRIPAGDPAAGYDVVHRIVGGSGAVDAAGWTTQGDNNPSPDIWTPHDRDIQGAVIANLGDTGLLLREARNPLLYCLLGALAVGRILWPSRRTEATPEPTHEATPARGRHAQATTS